jgi:hypothetical protein
VVVYREDPTKGLLAGAPYCGQADGVTAYLIAKVERDVYVQQPRGFAQPGKVCNLNQALYGLRGSAILWLRTLAAALGQFGFKPLKADPCAFVCDRLYFLQADMISVCGVRGDICFSSQRSNFTLHWGLANHGPARI